MLRGLFTLVFSISITFVFAQVEPHVCGQVNRPEQIAFLKANNPNLSLSFRPRMDTIRVPVLFQRIADENGNGAVTLADCANALVDLNALYASGRIVFEECEPPRLIADSAFYDYQYSEELALRQAHEVSGVINVFIPNRASSTSGGQVCGYAYLPPTRRDITIVKASCFTNGTTFPHEVGHFLGLYHTHGTSNCGSLTDELADGSNCDTGGDDVCDTPADPNLLGVDCAAYVVNSSCVYTGTAVDANGDAFNPDPRNIMSYSRKACRQGFSAGQLDRVRFFLGSTRSYLTCPVSICETTVPTLTVTGQSMTTISIAFDDNDQDRTEVEYTVVGGQTRGLSTPDLSIGLGGFSPCDSVMIRARNICTDGFGDWSSSILAATNGCGLRYCAQPGAGSEVLIDELALNGAALPSLQTAENYGIHLGQQTIVLDPVSPILSIDAKFDGNSNPAHFQVWVDFDNNSTFDSDELIVQERVSDAVNYTFTYQIDSTVSRDVPIRARFTVSQETYVDPCEIELGETEDVDLIFQGGFPLLQWGNGSLSLDAPARAVTVPISGNVNWTVSGLPSWLSASATTGSASDTEFNFSVERNEDCNERSATLVVDAGNGLSDELVITQSPAAAGIIVSVSDTLLVGPEGGDVQFTSESLHTYSSGANTGPFVQFSGGQFIGNNQHFLTCPFYDEIDVRYDAVTFEGCGVEASFVVQQYPGITSWGDTSTVQLSAIGDTILLGVNSSTMWDALANVSWIEHVIVNLQGDGEAVFVYTGGAANGEIAEITLEGFYGVTQGPSVVRVIAPVVSSVSSPRLSAKLILANPISDRLVATVARGSSPYGGTSAKTYQWSVHSILGQRMHASFGESLNLDTAHWPTGSYFVKLEDEAGRMLTEQIVKF